MKFNANTGFYRHWNLLYSSSSLQDPFLSLSLKLRVNMAKILRTRYRVDVPESTRRRVSNGFFLFYYCTALLPILCEGNRL